MRKRKTIRGSFYTNSETQAYPLVDLDNDWWITYNKNSEIYKIAPTGTTNATSTPIPIWTITESIVISPSGWTFAISGLTKQIVVYNQDGVNVTSECTFESSDAAKVTISAAGLLSSIGSGTSTITATHTVSEEEDTIDVVVS